MKVVRVCDIILDPLHPRYYGPRSMGAILWNYVEDLTPINGSCANSYSAKPLWKSTGFKYPVPNELVFIVSAPRRDFNVTQQYETYYLSPPISVNQNPNFEGLPNRTFGEDNSYYTGRYFKEKEDYNPLRVYEGDTIHEGRFGNSIRFGSTIDRRVATNVWSNKGEPGDPITIIRNGQKYGINQQDSHYNHITEDINKDDSSIYLCSTQQIGIIPASLNDASYGASLENETDNYIIEEPILENNDIPADTEEDVELTQPDNLPAQELIQDAELDNIDPEVAQFDIAPTENQNIDDTVVSIVLPDSYIIPSGSQYRINEPINV